MDDVTTTGNLLYACKEILLSNGADKVEMFALGIIEAMEKSGTMHTADFAIRQKKRLACYAAKLLELASGNRYLEETKKAHVLKSLDETEAYFDYIVNELEFTQMSLNWK